MDHPAETADALLPFTAEHASYELTSELLAFRLERIIRWRTAGRIRDLHVEITRETVRLDGVCSTYYLKQLAQHAAMEIAKGEQVVNAIEVATPRRRP